MIVAFILFWLALLLVVHSYVLYPITIWWWARSKTDPVANARRDIPTVSLVMSVFNEEKMIAAKLLNLQDLDFPAGKLEILIGSDGSTDLTSSLIGSFKNDSIRFTRFPDRRGKASVVNDLALAARNEILVFSDANTFYASDALQKLIRHFADPLVGGVCGNLRLDAEARNSGGLGEAAYWRYENLLKECEGRIRTTFGATGGIYALRRSLFHRLPTNKAVTDDFLLPLHAVRQGFRVVYDAMALGWEDTTSSTANEFQRKIRIGAQNFNGMTEILPLLHPRTGFVSFGLISHKLIRWFVPFLLIFIFITSMLLYSEGELYRMFFMAQCAFLFLAAVGGYLDKRRSPMMLFTMPYYFIVANVALLLGFFRFLRGTQRPAWSATRS